MVHPVAALVTLVLFIMAVITHMHAPSHSSRFLLIIFIFLFIDFLICLLAFLIDVLLFVPHLAWGSYLVLAATILVALSGLITCAMRRTLIGRKDRQKRIAENAEMSGENYYNRTVAQVKEEEVPRPPAIPLPPVSGANGVNNGSQPTFNSYEQNVKSDQISDENIPLTRRTTSNRSPVPPVEQPSVGEAFNNGPRRQGSRDQYGNPINEGMDGYGVRRGPSNERMRGRDMGPGGYRGGRGGGYGRGGYDNYGPPMRGRGGYGGPPGRGGYGPRGGRGDTGLPQEEVMVQDPVPCNKVEALLPDIQDRTIGIHLLLKHMSPTIINPHNLPTHIRPTIPNRRCRPCQGPSLLHLYRALSLLR